MITESIKKTASHSINNVRQFVRDNWIGTAILILATIAFFWPIISHIATYSPGGDAMFNAWEMRRNQNCLLGNNCPDYTDANIFYPNKDTMLYSETQLSAGVVTLPLYWLSDSPILAYNILTIVLFFLSGWFMYLLAKYLSKGNEYISILSGLIFAFAPLKMAAIFHLQNLSICILPLAVLFILQYFDKRAKGYLIGLFVSLLYVFFASWVQMVFVGVALGILLLGYLIFKLSTVRQIAMVALAIVLAAATTLPLAREYMRFSKETNATFSIQQQITYSSDVKDYFTPYDGTVLGKVYYKLNPVSQRNAYNTDSFSYHGLVLYAVFIFIVSTALFGIRKRKKALTKREDALVYTLAAIVVVGFIASLGPVLKLYGHTTYQFGHEITAYIPMPYILIDKFVPQLSFIRAIGRISVITLFALCCLLALLPTYLNRFKLASKLRLAIFTAVGLFILIELMPVHQVPMLIRPYTMNWSVPDVYRFVKEKPEINNIVLLNPNYDYPDAPLPIARAEQVLWAGYHNKNIFNGYSGYEPTNYVRDFEDFVDFDEQDVRDLKAKDLRYVLVDKGLSSQKPWVNDRVASILKNRVYDDERYSLYKVE